jgi:SAM-dependent methyltransferase
MSEYSIRRNSKEYCVDSLTVEISGLVRVGGWTRVPAFAPEKHITLKLDDDPVRPELCYSVYRPDLVSAGVSTSWFSGFVLDFVVPPDKAGCPAVVSLSIENRQVFARRCEFVIPHYNGLLTTTAVLHRDDIYAYGPPASYVDPVIYALAASLPGPLLDFGCGSGHLVRKLRTAGVDAYGLELDRSAIRESLTDEVRRFVTLYDGSFPVPFSDGAFAGLICSEVLEHIPDYEEALAQIGRVVEKAAIFTVPDMTAIPVLYPHNVVPWHLLESTHVNFFTPQSLELTLRKRFRTVRLSRIHPATVNGTVFYTNLVAWCEK